MKYLNQIVVLQSHIHELQEKQSIIIRMIEKDTPHDARTKINDELNAIDTEVKDTYRAIDLLKGVST